MTNLEIQNFGYSDAPRWDNSSSDDAFCTLNDFDFKSCEAALNKLWFNKRFEYDIVKMILEQEFRESNELFYALDDFFSKHFPEFNLWFYSYDKHTNELNWINSWVFMKKKISLSNFDSSQFTNEREALKRRWFSYSSWFSYWYWSKASIFVSRPLDDDVLITFHPKLKFYDKASIEYCLENKLLILLKKTFFHLLIKEKLNYINAKYVDSLTWLYNKKFLDEVGDEKMMSIIFLDLNSFKKINDIFGHVFWDYILRYFASIISSSIKNEDYAVRFWWDEFVLLLDTNDEQVLTRVSQRIQNAIEEKSLEEIIRDSDLTKEEKDKLFNLAKEHNINWLSCSSWYALNNLWDNFCELIAKADINMLSRKSLDSTIYRLIQEINGFDDPVKLRYIIENSSLKNVIWFNEI